MVAMEYADVGLVDSSDVDKRNDYLKRWIETYNERSRIYGQCPELVGNGWPSRGTMLFALNFYLHQAQGRTDRNDLDDLLTGKRDVSAADIPDLQGLEESYKVAIYVGVVLKKADFAKGVKGFRRC